MGYKFTKVEDIKDNKSIVKKGSTNGEGSTNGKTTVTKPGGEKKQTTTTPDPAKVASQANTSMSGSNVEFSQGVKNLAKRIDRNQAGRRSMKQETTQRIQEGDFTHGYAKLPSDVKKDNGALLGKYDRKMLKASNRQKNRLNKAAAKLGLQVTNVGTVNGKTLVKPNTDAKVTNSKINNTSSEKISETASSGVSMKEIVKNTVNKVGPGSGENPRGNNSKIDSNIKVKPGYGGYNPQSPAGPKDLQKAENEENNKFLKHEGKHLKVGEDYIPGHREYHKYNLVNDPNKFASANIKPMSFDDFGGKNSSAQNKFDNLTSFISKNPSNTEAKNLLKTQKERFLVNEPGSGIKIKKG